MLSINLQTTPYLSLALYGNDVPPVRSITVSQDSGYEQITYAVRLTCQPAVIKPFTWGMVRLDKETSLELPLTGIQLDYEMLTQLTETLPAIITVEAWVTNDPEQKTVQVDRVRLLPPKHWGGYAAVPELLAAHVLPNDSALAPLLRRAAELLQQKGLSLNEYQSGTPRQAAAQFLATMTVLHEKQILYASVPASFEDYGQKIRTPAEIIGTGIGNCLDLSCLGGAMLEQIGLHPIIITIKGHAFLACWLQPSPVSTGVIEDPQQLRKPFRSGLLLACEMTMLVNPEASVIEAIKRGGEQLLDPDKFMVAIDLHAARRGEGILPISQLKESSRLPSVSGDSGLAVKGLDLSSLDHLSSAPLRDEPEPKEVRTGAARVEEWKSKLLNLTRRNRLLNYRLTKGAIHLRYVKGGDLEDYLAMGKKIRFDVVDNARGKQEILTRKLKTDHYREVIVSQVRHGKLLVVDTPENLNRNLLTLDRSARTALEEGGANILFIAIGFAVKPYPGKAAEFRPASKAQDRPEYAAPLILLPVNLSRRSAASTFTISLRDDEPMLNPTLLEYLKRELQVDLSQYAYELPTDENGLDISGILGHVRAELLNVTGWEVTEEVALGLFDFKKYLMWRDLHNFEAALKTNPVVAHLIDTPREPFYDPTASDNVPFPQANSLDETFPVTEMLTPMSADSSQLAAVRAATKGINFILEGPPGTGKSQTITNMIAQLLGEGKKVLFVSEKKAALDVVQRRLDAINLGEFCLELHANNATKSAVYDQLRQALQRTTSTPEFFRSTAENLEQTRRQLNGLVNAIHDRLPIGLSVFAATSFAAQRVHLSAPAPAPDLLRNASADWLEESLGLVGQLAIYYSDISSAARQPLLLLQREVVIEQLLASANAMLEANKLFAESRDNFCDALQLKIPQTALTSAAVAFALDGLAAIILAAEGMDYTDLADMIDSGRVRRKVALQTEATFALAAAFEALSTVYRPEVAEYDANEAAGKWQRSENAFVLVRWVQQLLLARQVRAFATGEPTDIGADLKRLAEISTQKNKLPETLRRSFRLTDTSVETLRRRAHFAEILSAYGEEAHHTKLQLTVTQLAKILDHLAEEDQTAQEWLIVARAYRDAHRGAAAGAEQFVESKAGDGPAATEDASFEEFAQQASVLLEHQRDLRAFNLFAKLRTQANEKGLGYYTSSSAAGLEGGKEAATEKFKLGVYRVAANLAISENEQLKTFSGTAMEDLINRFQQLDSSHLRATTHEVRKRLHQQQEAVYRSKYRSALGILNQELQKKRRQIPVRQLVKQLGDLLTELTPCLLMSPLSIAQYLPAGAGGLRFDVVIFDEASQIPTWDAIGAIARGQQVIVVGDSKQLPPTAFFGATTSDQAVDYEEEAKVEDLESILDEMKAAQLRSWRLRWHYRSRAESLIAFSNRQYYGNDLNTFPAPIANDKAVVWHKVVSRAYLKGRNPREAQELVAHLTERLLSVRPEDTTFGVVTFGKAQQLLIEDLLEDARREHPGIEQHFNGALQESVFVKNIENVQGDERDVILFSITYGPDAAGKVAMRFGPMNQLGGERRLNVAVTRARREMHLFSSMEPEDIDLRRLGEHAQGARDLRYFMEFAKRGPKAFAERIISLGGSSDYDSPFEEAVAAALRARGYETDTQVGVSGYRIDLGIRDPQRPGHYLAGVECDGASYHSTATARERDLLRQGILESLGWKIIRVWSLDWWYDPERTADKLAEKLKGVRESSSLETIASPGNLRGGNQEVISLPDATEAFAQPASDLSQVAAAEIVYYQKTTAADLAEFREVAKKACRGVSVAEAFYDDRSSRAIAKMVQLVLEREAPIQTSVLISRIAAEGFGFARAGAQIQRRLEAFIPVLGHQVEVLGDTLVWLDKQQQAAGVATFRHPSPNTDYVRKVKEIPMLELKVLARYHLLTGLDGDTLIRAIGKDIGLNSVRGSSRDRIQKAVELAWESE